MKHWREMGLTVSTGPPTMFFVSNPDTILGAFSRGYHCVKSVRIRSFFVMHFPVFGLNTEDTPYLSVFNPNAGKCRSEKIRIRTLFTQCILRKIPLRY